MKQVHSPTCHCFWSSLIYPNNYLVHLQKMNIDPSKHSHQMLPIYCSKQYLPALQYLLARRTFLAYIYCFQYLPTHTYVPSNSFIPRLVPTLIHTDDLHLNTQKYTINFHLRHLIITSQIMFKASITPMP